MKARALLAGLAGNPALPSTLVDRMISRTDDDLAGELAQRSDLEPRQVRALARRSGTAMLQLAWNGLLDPVDVDPVAHPEVALALLDQGRGPDEWAELLAGDPDPWRREKLAACPGLPASFRARLAGDPESRVVAELAIFTTDRELLTRLAEHPHAEVRAGVAANPAAPPEVLAGLIAVHWRGTGGPLPVSCAVCLLEPVPFVHDPECPRLDCDLPPGAACDGTHESVIHSLLVRAVDNTATPADAAAELAGHPSLHVRWQLAARLDLPPDVAVRLAGDPNPGVRGAVAGNPALPEPMIRNLATDDSPTVRRHLASNPGVPLDLLARAARVPAGPLPRIAAASPDEVRQLAESRSPQLRALVAERRDLPPEIRDRLARDPDAKVVKAVAPHPGLSEDLLREMVTRHGVRVIVTVATNPDASSALLVDLARHVPPVQKVFREIARRPDAPAEALDRCLADPQARPIAAAHPALPVDRIVALIDDPDERVATAAATNPSLPVSAMERIIGRAP
ncbi:hypothetical protein Aph02nite_72320 [Actinoplanes philippinensis]|uniref:Leucine rich repeat variant n=1 Tax=Actinoplanes philippinensis TaxID=35752 RepID=A0A1I2K0W2_9ACTN|nr:hypothetical protein [Actinoplanes philippinensis]GIE81282.1 hypothetical protein Aph02nite_72320 [Actinoplanes philippinensis]SFF58731.1 hypothetical protein SAMN05421541_11479 [Actinoplanes philippinensis]